MKVPLEDTPDWVPDEREGSNRPLGARWEGARAAAEVEGARGEDESVERRRRAHRADQQRPVGGGGGGGGGALAAPPKL